MQKLENTIARNASIVAGATLLSRVLGFVRDMIVAFALGAGLFADAFFVAFRLPNLFRRLFGEGSLTISFVPVYSRVREKEGEEAAQAMARSALIWLALILCFLTLLVEILARPLTLCVAPGFVAAPELLQVTVDLVRLCFPYVIFICGVALCMGILNANGHFFGPAIAPVVLNLSLISSALIGYWFHLNVAYCMAYGVLIGGVGQWLLQQPFLVSSGFRWRGPWEWKNSGVLRMGVLMLPTVFGAAVYQINIVMGTLLASLLPVGSISYLYYADRLVQFPLGVFGYAIATAALPSLAKLAVQGKMEEYDAGLATSLGLTLFIALPAASGLIGLANPIISFLFERGAFTPEAVNATAEALVAYSIGLPFIALARPLIVGFYALEETRIPVVVAAVCLVVNIGCGFLLMQFYAHVGLALSVSLSSCLNFVSLLVLLGRKRGKALLPFVSVLKIMVLSLGVGAGAWLVSSIEGWWLLSIPLLVFLYIWFALLLEMDEAHLMVNALKGRFVRRLKAKD